MTYLQEDIEGEFDEAQFRLSIEKVNKPGYYDQTRLQWHFEKKTTTNNEEKDEPRKVACEGRRRLKWNHLN